MPKGYHQLTKDQRCRIFALYRTGKSQKEIARAIGCRKSSISSELSRNKFELVYEYNYAHRTAQESWVDRGEQAS